MAGLINTLRPVLIKHEGYELHVYPDSLGNPTIGIGVNLAAAGAKALVEKSGADYDALLAGNVDLTTEQCEFLFSQCVIRAVEGILTLLPDFSTYSLPRQVALVDMAFMGVHKLAGFHGMLSAIRQEEWNVASAEALDSLWAKQVGNRAQEDAHMLAQG